jgi:hypothetical protein
MRSTLYPPAVAHAVGWHRAISAIAILVCGLLLVFAAANTPHSAMTGGLAAPTTISIIHPVAPATDMNAAAITAARGQDTARSNSSRHLVMHGVDASSPLEPDLWLDDDDDDDDDEVGRHGRESRASSTHVEEAPGLRRPTRTLGGSSAPDGSLLVNLLLSESVRRM